MAKKKHTQQKNVEVQPSVHENIPISSDVLVGQYITTNDGKRGQIKSIVPNTPCIYVKMDYDEMLHPFDIPDVFYNQPYSSQPKLVNDYLDEKYGKHVCSNCDARMPKPKKSSDYLCQKMQIPTI